MMTLKDSGTFAQPRCHFNLSLGFHCFLLMQDSVVDWNQTIVNGPNYHQQLDVLTFFCSFTEDMCWLCGIIKMYLCAPTFLLSSYTEQREHAFCNISILLLLEILMAHSLEKLNGFRNIKYYISIFPCSLHLLCFFHYIMFLAYLQFHFFYVTYKAENGHDSKVQNILCKNTRDLIIT